MPSNSGYEQIKEDEGFSPKASHHTLQSGEKEKVKTIGYGYNINAADDPEGDLLASGVPESDIKDVLEGKKAITKEQADVLFDRSVRRAAQGAAKAIDNFDSLDKPVQDVLINMSYQMGADNLREFGNMRKALVAGDFKAAAKHLLDSEYARKDATNRANRLAKQLSSYADKAPPPKKAPKPPTAEEYVKNSERAKREERLSLALKNKQKNDRLVQALTAKKTVDQTPEKPTEEIKE